MKNPMAEEKQSSKKQPDTSVEEKIKHVNDILAKGEPGNISMDAYSGFTGYKPQFIIDAMNAVFGIGGWGFEELQTSLEGGKENASPTLAIGQVKVWIKGIDFTPVGWGQNRI